MTHISKVGLKNNLSNHFAAKGLHRSWKISCQKLDQLYGLVTKAIREHLGLAVKDALEWKVEKGKILIYPATKNFLKYRNAVKVGKVDIAADIEMARKLRMDKYRWNDTSLTRMFWFPSWLTGIRNSSRKLPRYSRMPYIWRQWFSVISMVWPSLFM